jgi:hypothetical protein
MIYNLDYWVRHLDEKDLRHTEIEADTFEQAKQILEKRECWVFRVELSE